MFSFLKKISLLGHFWQEKNNLAIFRWNLIFFVVQSVILFFKYRSLPPQIPLYYSLPWGESQLASTSHLTYLPILSLLVLIINSFLAALLTRSNALLSKLLIVISLIFSFFSLISVYQIVFLVS